MSEQELWSNIKFSHILAVRAAILDVSKRTINMPTIERLRSKESIEAVRKNAKRAGEEAEKFDPHSRLFSLLNWISIRKRQVVVLAGLFSVTAYFILDISEQKVVNMISTISSPILVFGIIGVVLYTLWNAYLIILHYNKNLVQRINKMARYSDQRIETETSVENVRAYHRWNSNLTNASTLTIIILLAAARSLFPSIFSIGIEESREWVPEYVEMRVDEANSEGGQDKNESG